MPVTQKQIAAELGVSWSLVTRALRDHPSVAPATRQRIQSTATVRHAPSSQGATGIA